MTALDEIAAERRIRVTFEVNPPQLFDVLVKVGDGGHALGARLVSALLAPADVGALDAMGMAFYGVTVVPTDRAAQEATDAE